MPRLSPRLALLDLVLRLVVKPRLARARDPVRQRRLFERDARLFFRLPHDAEFAAESIPRPDGPPMPALWAWRGRPDPRRTILFLHGGAFVMGSTVTHRHIAAALAGQAGARALVPDYRLAPEHPFPAGLEDALLAYRHLLAGGHDPGRIALAGDSAGGGLVFSLVLKIEGQDLPPPAAVVAFSPWADLTGAAPSLRRNARRDAMLPAERFADIAEMYLQGKDAADPLASPVHGRFAAPPPALILASRDEILADDATAMAEALRRDGGEARVEHWPGLPHDWPLARGRLAQADRALTQAGDFLGEHIGAA